MGFLQALFCALLSFIDTVFTYRSAWVLSALRGWSLEYIADLLRVWPNYSHRLLLWAAAPAEAISWMIERRVSRLRAESPCATAAKLSRVRIVHCYSSSLCFEDFSSFFVGWLLTSVFQTGFLCVWSRDQPFPSFSYQHQSAYHCPLIDASIATFFSVLPRSYWFGIVLEFSSHRELFFSWYH